MHLINALLLGALGALAPWQQPAAGTQSAPWSYAVGETRAPQQANFCDTRELALEVARVFERFGPRTGFAALAHAPGCSLRVHGVTPRALLHQVRVALESGDSYVVNFIDVDADDGSTPVLVTTRLLTGTPTR